MRRTSWRWARVAGGLVVLAAVARQLGASAFRQGLAGVDVRLLLVAGAIAALTTVCAAWRWSLVARGLGVALPLRTAVAACYRSQFLNSTLPGGVVGDVHRALSHGRDVGDVSRGLRSVGWERSGGQAVQGLVTVAVLLAAPSPLRSSMPRVVLVGGLVTVFGALLLRATWRRRPRRLARLVGAAAADVRQGLLASRAWPGIVVASVVVVAGHAGTFLIAARAVGSDASWGRLLPPVLLVLLASGVPANVAGWGPREGAAAWVFGAAGLGASSGVSTAVAYGVMALVASLPGAAVLVVQRMRRDVGRRAAPFAVEVQGVAGG